jgi:hypothetical protein
VTVIQPFCAGAEAENAQRTRKERRSEKMDFMGWLLAEEMERHVAA